MSEESRWFYERITALESQLQECQTRCNELEAQIAWVNSHEIKWV
jgi:hypothetical protein